MSATLDTCLCAAALSFAFACMAWTVLAVADEIESWRGGEGEDE